MWSKGLRRCALGGIPAVVSLALCAAILACAVPRAAAQPSKALPAKVAELIPAAKQEGELVIFGQALNPSQARAVSQALGDFYGFPIKLNVVVGLHVAKAAEVVDAAKHGVPSGLDIFWTTAENIETLSKGGALEAFDWTKALGLDPALKFSEYGLKSHDGVLSSVFYNTGLVKPADAPKSYQDLLDPKWRGRIAMPRSPGPWVNLTYALGEEETARLLEALIHQQQAKLLPTYPDVKARVISGEFSAGNWRRRLCRGSARCAGRQCRSPSDRARALGFCAPEGCAPPGAREALGLLGGEPGGAAASRSLARSRARIFPRNLRVEIRRGKDSQDRDLRLHGREFRPAEPTLRANHGDCSLILLAARFAGF